MRKAPLTLALAAALGLATIAAPSSAEARRGFFPGLAGGLIAGAVIGGIASSAYAYGPGYGYYGPRYYGGYAPTYYGGYAPTYYNGYAPAYYGGYAPAYYGGYYSYPVVRYRTVVRYRPVVRPVYPYYQRVRYYHRPYW